MVPLCLGNFSDSLRVLDLRSNKINGTIPATFTEGNYLRSLNLNDNQLVGSLPRLLINCRRLEVLDLGNNKISGGNNKISGTFPHWLESLLELRVLVLRSNKFHGAIANPKTKFSFPNLRIIDLSHNEFHGLLPTKYFNHFEAMMSMNANNGHMPPSLGNLTNLELLNISSNMLTRNIPRQLADIASLEVLNLSENRLVGPIPVGNQFNTFANVSYFGNLGLGLCGFPLTRICDNVEGQQPCHH
ncbi:hypothetical protein SO802_010698 [Lithocarpus litseifolius]|uniref:Uncharacterized protein n=1 Tax=Lithocarpus litseifolius TaxID=425828 RepID=A0AAW2DJG1_9ROSI